MILELKDKLDLEEAFESKLMHAAEEAGSFDIGIKNEAVQALAALGYSSAEALKAVNAVEFTEGITVEEVLKSALKQMAFL